MTLSCENCGADNRAHANFCIGCAAKLPGFAATGPSALELLKARETKAAPARSRAGVQAQQARADAAALPRLLVAGGVLMALCFTAWYLYITRPASAAIAPARDDAVVLQPAVQQLGALDPDLSALPEVSPAARAAAARTTWSAWATAERELDAVDTVTRFYRALSAGDGATAAGFVIAPKRVQGPLSGAAMTAFYGPMAQPLAIHSVRQLEANVVEARYTYRATRTACEGRALVTMDGSGPAAAIRSIAANC